MTMTPTARRAGGLAGMLAAAGALVLLKSASPGPSSTLHVATHAAAAQPVHLTSVSGTAVGSVSQTPFGPVQVQVTVQAGRIVAVQALQLPNSLSYSQQVAAYAAPVLRQEVLSAQSANIDAVSGATYTSQGYADSVQSALDKLHLKA